ncbi:DUF2063 domain-containing protein [Permianibacter sp. IMCC34836]|uniref:HvfC/BufC N-terminal domain-containing protein n=1 Tax=Permianibacter fluminis TaxID=2738515 RepID=UPI0015537252|nr:putative DNA-binding domain-containing protein [Permianibacter fluminis]NQD38000.1 DUF2063 domain-containing protein [Permianibacter fluminis]
MTDLSLTSSAREPLSQQAAFARALLDPLFPVEQLAVRTPAIASADNSLAQRFAVHRNNVVAGLVNGLQDSFPATVRLLGEEFFRAVATEYVRAFPPQSPVLSEYGGTLANFLPQLTSLQTYPYVADVAQLEWLRRRAYHSADQSVLSLTAIRKMPIQQLLFQRFSLHPSVHWLRSDYPVVSLWRSQMGEGVVPEPEHWHAETALIWRPGHSVQVAVITPTRLTLLEQLQSGAVLADAMAAIGAPIAVVSQHFSALAQAGVLCAGDLPVGADSPPSFPDFSNPTIQTS